MASEKFGVRYDAKPGPATVRASTARCRSSITRAAYIVLLSFGCVVLTLYYRSVSRNGGGCHGFPRIPSYGPRTIDKRESKKLNQTPLIGTHPHPRNNADTQTPTKKTDTTTWPSSSGMASTTTST